MESPPQNPDFKKNLENFHPCHKADLNPPTDDYNCPLTTQTCKM